MTPRSTVHPITAPLDEGLLDLEALCRLAAVPPAWVIERVESGLLQVCQGRVVGQWRFDAVALHRVRRMRHYERDFEAVPELAALVSDLLDEIAALRAQLRRRA